jgi:hypothetical protein
MDINRMTRKQIMNVPSRKWDDCSLTFDCIVIVPLRKVHDSGYRMIDCVAVVNDEPIARLSGCSDSIILKKGSMEWKMDCLRISGLFRLWVHGSNLKCGPALSTFEVLPVRRG